MDRVAWVVWVVWVLVVICHLVRWVQVWAGKVDALIRASGNNLVHLSVALVLSRRYI